jgi:hypothetical protein
MVTATVKGTQHEKQNKNTKLTKRKTEKKLAAHQNMSDR